MVFVKNSRPDDSCVDDRFVEPNPENQTKDPGKGTSNGDTIFSAFAFLRLAERLELSQLRTISFANVLEIEPPINCSGKSQASAIGAGRCARHCGCVNSWQLAA
jgi:hypothetical protein